jgi:C6 transcription factor Pro1
MYYLGFILPLQFLFYQPSVADGGKGWLLALLLQTRPLHQAALSLAAWHRKAAMRCVSVKAGPAHEENGGKEEGKGFGSEQQLYERSIAGLRGRIETLSQKGLDDGLKDSIEALAYIVQLILLEVSFLEILCERVMVGVTSR